MGRVLLFVALSLAVPVTGQARHGNFNLYYQRQGEGIEYRGDRVYFEVTEYEGRREATIGTIRDGYVNRVLAEGDFTREIVSEQGFPVLLIRGANFEIRTVLTNEDREVVTPNFQPTFVRVVHQGEELHFTVIADLYRRPHRS
jgi:hypothetical protein